MYDNVMNVSEAVCTGCSACMNVCPYDAISMKYNEEGFLMPFVDENKCIDCGKCVEKCPSLHIRHKNRKDPTIFAVMAENDIRSKSSSGGMFTLLAEKILDQGGLVCGAAFDDDFRLSHVLIDSKSGLEPLKKSKYVQSNIDYIYREIKNALDMGKKVLFVGTPCQVAGAKAYVGYRYYNFFTVDILCHGVPSDMVFRKYVEEVSARHTGRNSALKDIQFRNKDFGWNCNTIYMEFAGCDKPYVNSKKDGDMFEYAYHHSLMLRKSCGNCKFASYPRQGDISMGDFWDISKLDRSMHDKNGTSIVFVNNDKGMELFLLVCNRFKKFKKMSVEPRRIVNRIRAKQHVNKHRDSFLQMVRIKTLEEAIDSVRTENKE